MEGLKHKLKSNQETATIREKSIFKKNLSNFVLSEKIMNVFTPSQLSNEDRMLKVFIPPSIDCLIEEERLMSLKDIRASIKNNWNSSRDYLRYISLVLISFLPPNEFYKYIPHVFALSFDSSHHVSQKAKSMLVSIKENGFIERLSEEQLDFLVDFIKKNYDSSDKRLRYACAELFLFLPKKSSVKLFKEALQLFDLSNNSELKNWLKELSVDNPEVIAESIRDAMKNSKQTLAMEVARFIQILPEDKIISLIPDFLLFVRSSEFYETFYGLKGPFKVSSYIKGKNEEELKPLLNFVDKNWNSKDISAVIASTFLLKNFSREIQSKYKLQIAILSNYFIPEVSGTATALLLNLTGKSSDEFFSNLSEEQLKFMTDFVSLNWDSSQPYWRHASALLITRFPEHVSKKFIPLLLLLSFDMDSFVRKVAKYSFNSILPNSNPEIYLFSLTNDKLKSILDFILSNHNPSSANETDDYYLSTIENFLFENSRLFLSSFKLYMLSSAFFYRSSNSKKRFFKFMKKWSIKYLYRNFYFPNRLRNFYLQARQDIIYVGRQIKIIVKYFFENL